MINEQPLLILLPITGVKLQVMPHKAYSKYLVSIVSIQGWHSRALSILNIFENTGFMKFPIGDQKNKYETASDISEIAVVMAKFIEDLVEVDLSGNFFSEGMQSSWRCRVFVL